MSVSPQNLHDSAQAMRVVIALFRSRTIYWGYRRDAIRKSASDVATVDWASLKGSVGDASKETAKTNILIGTVFGAGRATFANTFASWGNVMPRSRIELRHVRYIIAAAESGSFRRAAQDLGVGQSAISRRIRDVEEEIGAQLFRRHSAGVDLTEIGNQFSSTCAGRIS